MIDCSQPRGTKQIIASKRELWDHGLLVWNALGPPLRPCREDLRTYQQASRSWTDRFGPPRVLVLGATPEFAHLDWPHGTDIIAADRNSAMLDRIWPGFPEQGQGTMVADWTALPLDDCSRDLVLGDGSFTPISFPDGHTTLFHHLYRVLSPNGRAVIRFFLQRDRPESTEDVRRDLQSGTIKNFHVLKWRFTMSLQKDCRSGVQLSSVFRMWQDMQMGLEAIAKRCAPHLLATVNWYENQDQCYVFPTLAELRETFRPWFRERSIYFPSYQLGRRCPVITLERRRVAA